MTRIIHPDSPQCEDAAIPLVSIIIPTYNSGHLLDSTISSCLKIKSVTTEVLVVDDSSTDGTPEHVFQSYPSVHVYRLPSNSGSGAAGRNFGLSVAKGRYVKFLDHDDLIQPRGFKAECIEALRSDADIVMSHWGVVAIDNDGRFRKSDLRLFKPPDPSCLIEAILLGKTVPFTGAALYKRSYVEGELWDADAATIDDFDWFCRMATRGGSVTSVDAISYFWRQHSQSIQGKSYEDETIFDRFMSIRFRVYQKVEASLQSHGRLTPARKSMLARCYYNFLRYLAPSGSLHWRQLLAKIYELDPGFVVDETSEPDPRIRWVIQQSGLPFFLSSYGLLKRFSVKTRQILD